MRIKTILALTAMAFGTGAFASDNEHDHVKTKQASTQTGVSTQVGAQKHGADGPRVPVFKEIKRADFLKNAQERFDKFDTNKDGVITEDEHRAARQAMHEQMKKMRGARLPAEAEHPGQPSGPRGMERRIKPSTLDGEPPHERHRFGDGPRHERAAPPEAPERK